MKSGRLIALLSAIASLTVFVTADGSSAPVETDGPLHQELTARLAQQPDLQQITIHDPRKCRTLKRRPTPCTWHMMIWELGEYGVETGYARVKTGHRSDGFVAAFPCTITRRDMRTVCKGPLPNESEPPTWYLSYKNTPSYWTGPFPTAPKSVPYIEYAQYANVQNAADVHGLMLAKSIQDSGLYTGKAKINTVRYGNTITFSMAATSLNGEECVYSDLSFDDNTIPLTSVHVEWTSWIEEGGLLLDMTVRPTESLESIRKTIGYSKADMIGSHILLPSGSVKYSFDNTNKCSLEPRLCKLSSVASACHLIANLTGPELQTLGNVTGVRVNKWGTDFVRGDKRILIEGYALGSSGVIYKQYVSPISDTEDVGWLELPFASTLTCLPGIYSVSMCADLPAGAPALGTYTKEFEEHFTFP